MSPILGARGGLSASAYGLFGVAASTNSYESIATTTLGSAQSSITFSSIPSTYKHLQVRALAGSAGSATDSILIRLNSDTTATNYYWHRLYGDGSTAFSGASNANTVIDVSGTGTYFSGSVVDILDYTNTNKYTTIRTLSGYDANGSGRVGLNSTLWKNTAAVTDIVFVIQGGSNFPTYSQFALYGVKG